MSRNHGNSVNLPLTAKSVLDTALLSQLRNLGRRMGNESRECAQCFTNLKSLDLFYGIGDLHQLYELPVLGKFGETLLVSGSTKK